MQVRHVEFGAFFPVAQADVLYCRTHPKAAALTSLYSNRLRVEYFQAQDQATAKLVWIPPNTVENAVEAAKNSDVVVAVVGITAALEGEEMDIDAPDFKGGDRTSLDLPDTEEALLKALQAAGKPLVVVLMCRGLLGRLYIMMTIPDIGDRSTVAYLSIEVPITP